MSANASGGSPAIRPQKYQTIVTTTIAQAEQQDRSLNRSELDQLSGFFQSGEKLLKIITTISQNADQIVAAGGNRIFWGGDPMEYLEKPRELVNLPGFGKPVSLADAAVARQTATDKARKLELRLVESTSTGTSNPVSRFLKSIQGMVTSGAGALPGGFRTINISRYGPIRMKRSMRDLAWFLRYVSYAIVAGDTSILTANCVGLRGVMPEDITMATVVALQEMRGKALSYFAKDVEATNIVSHYFDVLIEAYQVQKPTVSLRQGISKDQQGLQLPQSYLLSADPRPKFMLKPNLSATEKQAAIKAAYRQVFEFDITRAYGLALTDLESKVNGGNISMKEFIRGLGKSRLYRRQFYEPFSISRAIELAFRHFLGRGLSSLEEFQDYFDIISKGGLPALVDTLVDSEEYSDYFGEETVPYLRGLGQEAQECRNWGPQLDLFKFSAPVRKVPQFLTLFANYQKPLPNQHPYGSGNDPLEIRFGAIFPQEKRNPSNQPAPFGKDNRRILISNGFGNAASLGKAPSSSTAVLRLDSATNGNGGVRTQGPNVSLLNHSAEAVVQGAYHQVFGRDVFAGQRLTSEEVKLKGGQITTREFIRLLAKSPLFRRSYWEKLYITKAIEYIHRRLLGRPTYGRQEMSRYYDIAARQGFYALVDEIIDSPEYQESFGEDTVPYERYITPRGFAQRSLRESPYWTEAQLNRTVTAAEFVAQKIQQKNQKAKAADQKPAAAPATRSSPPPSPAPAVASTPAAASATHSQTTHNQSTEQKTTEAANEPS